MNEELLVKYLLGEASVAEMEMVDQWLAADDANRKYLLQLRQIWQSSLPNHPNHVPDVEEAWQRFRVRIQQATQKEPTPIRFTYLRIAAAVILVAAIGSISYLFFRDNAPVQQLVQANTQVLQDTLPDGSVVVLNQSSSISYPSEFKGTQRMVTLQGEAFFNVAPDKQKPFIIGVNDIEIKVVGTSFNVKSYHGQTEVIVETGVVEVLKDGNRLLLQPGEKTTVNTTDRSLTKENTSDQLYKYYRTKEFVCDNTPLWKLVQVLNEAYNSHIVIGREEIRNMRITSPFYNESLDQVLKVISLTFDIRVIKKDDQIILQ